MDNILHIAYNGYVFMLKDIREIKGMVVIEANFRKSRQNGKGAP